MRKLLYILLLFCFLYPFKLLAQDYHLSQFYSTPLELNPASAGFFKGDYRLITNYRRQWGGVTSPYKTMAMSYDMPVWRDKEDRKFLAAGLYVYNDKAGDSNMGTLQANGVVSANIRIAKRHELAAGITVGYGQHTISTGGLKWDSQFDGYSYNASSGSSEGASAAYRALDVGVGALWHFYTLKNHKINVGLSMLHVNLPKASYKGNFFNRLGPKIVLQANSTFKLGSTNKYIVPYLLLTKQGPQYEFTGGMLLKYVMGLDSRYTDANTSSAIYIGAFYRFADAVVLAFRLDYKNNLSVGVSYDLNLSKLRTVSYLRGGPEITLAYTGFFKVFAGHKKAASI